jgi:uncharacterized protein YdhG (YjbR/CyaY superfamily)
MSPKMKKAVSVDAYLADLPADARATLEKIRRAIDAAAPNATETIAYGMPAFDYAGRPLVITRRSRTIAASSLRATR